MCRSVLALDSQYTDVRPRHPDGGPDGGRDIEARFDDDCILYGAVGFQNNANDSTEQKKVIKKKFTDDLASALKAKPDLDGFIFLTNLRFTMGEQTELKKKAHKLGVRKCDVLDRERLRIELDSPSGFFIRFQHLEIPLSEAEQASFLSRYGEDIQQVVTSGFGKVEKILNRILFLQESTDILHTINVLFRLKDTYPADEISHFRAFVYLTLREIKHDILSIVFGSSDKSSRFSEDFDRFDKEPAGIAYGISGGQWEQHFKFTKSNENSDCTDGDEETIQRVGSSSSIGYDPIKSILARYSHDISLIRFRPRLTLKDLDDCMFLPMLNQSLAEKVLSIEVYANGYQLAAFEPDSFRIDKTSFDCPVPHEFSSKEMDDPWVRFRPNRASCFHLRFVSNTPRRIFEFKEITSSENS